MGSKIRTLVVFDTSSLIEYESSYNSFSFNYSYNEIQSFIKENNLDELVHLAIPAMVIEELKQQKIENYLSDISKLKEKVKLLSPLPDVSLKLPPQMFDYEQHIEKLTKEFLKFKKIETIPFPKRESFKKVILRAIKRKKPFIKTDKHSDYGFKDVVIWESLLDYPKIKKYSKIIFITNDSTGFDEYCCSEFQLKLNRMLLIANSSKQVIDQLVKEYDIPYDPVIKFSNKDYFRDHLIEELSKKKEILTSSGRLRISRFKILKICTETGKIDVGENSEVILNFVKSEIEILTKRGSKEKVISTTYLDDRLGFEGEIEYEPEVM